jgi:nitroreductase
MNDAVPHEPPPPRTDEHAALWARYRGAAPSGRGPWNDVLATILAHRSVRAYRPDPLPAGTLERLIAAAQSAASSSNLQTWSVVAVEDPGRKARLAALAGGQRHIVQCPLFLVWLADLGRLRAVGAMTGAATAGLDYLESFLVAAIDAALAAQNAVVALESLGLGSVYIGALRNRPEEVAAELGLPPDVAAVFGLCVGYADPADASDVKPRLPQGVVLHRETYQQAVTAATLAAYDGEMAAFQTEQGQPAMGWTKAAIARVRGPESLGGRDRLRAALTALGFALR